MKRSRENVESVNILEVNNKFMKSCFIFNRVCDFTNLFLCDVLHDQFKENSLIKIKIKEYGYLIKSVCLGILLTIKSLTVEYFSMIYEKNSKNEKLTKEESDILNLHNKLCSTVSSGFENFIRNFDSSFVFLNGELTLNNFEIKMEKFLSAYYDKKLIKNNFSESKLVNVNYTIDACRLSNVYDKDQPCLMYSDESYLKKGITTAILIDSGFMKEHLEYSSYEKFKNNTGLEKNIYLCNFHNSFQLKDTNLQLNGEFMTCFVDSDIRNPILKYKEIMKANDTGGIHKTCLFDNKTMIGKYTTVKSDVNYLINDDNSTKKLTKTSRFKIMMDIYYKSFNKFNGDFNQLAFVHCFNKTNLFSFIKNLKNPSDDVHLKNVTRDKIMTIISVLLINESIFTNVDNNVYYLSPNSLSKNKNITIDVSLLDIIYLKT